MTAPLVPHPAVTEKWISSGYTTSAPAVLHSQRWCQVTNVIIERIILVLPQSLHPVADVRIYYTNQTTVGDCGSSILSEIFSGLGILQSI